MNETESKAIWACLSELKKELKLLNERFFEALGKTSKALTSHREKIDEIDEKTAHIEESCNAVEMQVDEAWEAIEEIQNRITAKKESKTPHKCPVCNGSGYKEPEHVKVFGTMEIDGTQFKCGDTVLFKQNCKTCEGKGIVWG